MSIREDEEIKSAMRSIGRSGEAPAGAVAQIMATAKRRRSIGRGVGIAGAVASVAVVVAAVAAVAHVTDAQNAQPASTAEPAPADWRELTGRELGEALGWTPQQTGEQPCSGWFSEFVDEPGQEPWGFCYTAADLEAAGLPATELDQRVFAQQINGYERTPELTEWVQLRMELMDLHSESELDLDRVDEIRARLRVLGGHGGLRQS